MNSVTPAHPRQELDQTLCQELETMLARAYPAMQGTQLLFHESRFAMDANAVSMALSDMYRRGRVRRAPAIPELHGAHARFVYQLTGAALVEYVDEARRAEHEAGFTGLGVTEAPVSAKTPIATKLDAEIDIQPTPATAVASAIAPPQPTGDAWPTERIAPRPMPAPPTRKDAQLKRAAATKPAKVEPTATEPAALAEPSIAAAAAAAAAAFRCALWSDGTFEIQGIEAHRVQGAALRLVPAEITQVIEYLECFDRTGRAA
jgi:hypothetical protein